MAPEQRMPRFTHTASREDVLRDAQFLDSPGVTFSYTGQHGMPVEGPPAAAVREAASLIENGDPPGSYPAGKDCTIELGVRDVRYLVY